MLLYTVQTAGLLVAFRAAIFGLFFLANFAHHGRFSGFFFAALKFGGGRILVIAGGTRHGHSWDPVDGGLEIITFLNPTYPKYAAPTAKAIATAPTLLKCCLMCRPPWPKGSYGILHVCLLNYAYHKI